MAASSAARGAAPVLTVRRLLESREPNRGAACTSACVLTALRALGAGALPDLAAATLRLGARTPLGPPPLGDYLRLPGRVRAPLDLAIEALARDAGLRVRSRTGLTAPWSAPRPGPGTVLIAHLAYGQERPDVRGTWGWNPVRPRTWATGGHSVVVAGTGPGRERVVVDPNWDRLQRWPGPGWSMTATRISRLR